MKSIITYLTESASNTDIQLINDNQGLIGWWVNDPDEGDPIEEAFFSGIKLSLKGDSLYLTLDADEVELSEIIGDEFYENFAVYLLIAKSSSYLNKGTCKNVSKSINNVFNSVNKICGEINFNGKKYKFDTVESFVDEGSIEDEDYDYVEDMNEIKVDGTIQKLILDKFGTL